MSNERIINYVGQLSMLKVLFSKKLITEIEYKILEKRIQNDYGMNPLEIT